MIDLDLELQKRVTKYEEKKLLTPVFWFMKLVKVTSGFYEWFSWLIYKELDYCPHPDFANYPQDWFALSYLVIILKGTSEELEDWAVLDHREINATHLTQS